MIENFIQGGPMMSAWLLLFIFTIIGLVFYFFYELKTKRIFQVFILQIFLSTVIFLGFLFLLIHFYRHQTILERDMINIGLPDYQIIIDAMPYWTIFPKFLLYIICFNFLVLIFIFWRLKKHISKIK